MKKIYGILFLLALMAFKTNVQAQTCAGVTAQAISMGPTPSPTPGLNTLTNDYVVKVTLSHTYSQNITVNGFFYDASGPANVDHPYTVIVAAGSLSEQTAQIYTADATAGGVATIESVTPCPAFELLHLKPQSSEVITTANSLYTNFVNATRVFQLYPSLALTDQNLGLVALDDTTIKVIIISITGVGSANKLVAVCNTQKSEYMFYFMEYSSANGQNEAVVYDENNTFIYRTFQTPTTFNISMTPPLAFNYSSEKEPSIFFNASFKVGTESSSMSPTTCFSQCMSGQQHYFEATFSGWWFWNIFPGQYLQAAAAIHCAGGCRGWWLQK